MLSIGKADIIQVLSRKIMSNVFISLVVLLVMSTIALAMLNMPTTV